jgi:hypothetical protein
MDEKFTTMMRFGHNTHMKNVPTYKEKWATIYRDYKRIWDYMGVTCQNEDFWNMCATNRLASNLPRLFNKSIFKMIHSFMSRRPIFEPPHSCDFMDPNYNVYTPKSSCQEFEVILHNHNSLTQDDFNPFIYNNPKPQYTMFNVQNICITQNKPSTLTIIDALPIP